MAEPEKLDLLKTILNSENSSGGREEGAGSEHTSGSYTIIINAKNLKIVQNASRKNGKKMVPPK